MIKDLPVGTGLALRAGRTRAALCRARHEAPAEVDSSDCHTWSGYRDPIEATAEAHANTFRMAAQVFRRACPGFSRRETRRRRAMVFE